MNICKKPLYLNKLTITRLAKEDVVFVTWLVDTKIERSSFLFQDKEHQDIVFVPGDKERGPLDIPPCEGFSYLEHLKSIDPDRWAMLTKQEFLEMYECRPTK